MKTAESWTDFSVIWFMNTLTINSIITTFIMLSKSIYLIRVAFLLSDLIKKCIKKPIKAKITQKHTKLVRIFNLLITKFIVIRNIFSLYYFSPPNSVPNNFIKQFSFHNLKFLFILNFCVV